MITDEIMMRFVDRTVIISVGEKGKNGHFRVIRRKESSSLLCKNLGFLFPTMSSIYCLYYSAAIFGEPGTKYFLLLCLVPYMHQLVQHIC